MISSDAERIHKNAIIVEGHRDLFEMVRLSDQGHKHSLLNVTYPRLKRANITTTFYSIAGDSVTHSRGTRQFLKSALENIDMLREEIEASQGKMKLILHADDLPSAPTPNELSVVMSFEGGRPLEGRVENLRNFYRLGLRSMQITWNLRNELADGVKEERTGGGLTNFGEAVVKEMDRLGMLIDLAHISRAGWFGVLEVASGPVCCTHSNCRKVFHHFRTIDDDQIKALAQTGGVLGVNAIATMVSKQPTLDKLVDHISHIADMVGIDHVGLGLDFVKDDGPLYPEDEIFGVGENRLIPEFENEDDLPNITECMVKRGFREDDIVKVLGGNFLRLLKAVLKPRSAMDALGLPAAAIAR
ncbi:MAG: rane dipeptidase [Alphaproteobacteria bacterium]|jgi:membrane dipeptidase|nr:rane dipeptidase [Alphaproteobacteria bacterium]